MIIFLTDHIFMWSVTKIEFFPCAFQNPSCLVEYFLVEHFSSTCTSMLEKNLRYKFSGFVVSGQLVSALRPIKSLTHFQKLNLNRMFCKFAGLGHESIFYTNIIQWTSEVGCFYSSHRTIKNTLCFSELSSLRLLLVVAWFSIKTV